MAEIHVYFFYFFKFIFIHLICHSPFFRVIFRLLRQRHKHIINDNLSQKVIHLWFGVQCNSNLFLTYIQSAFYVFWFKHIGLSMINLDQIKIEWMIFMCCRCMRIISFYDYPFFSLVHICFIFYFERIVCLWKF